MHRLHRLAPHLAPQVCHDVHWIVVGNSGGPSSADTVRTVDKYHRQDRNVPEHSHSSSVSPDKLEVLSSMYEKIYHSGSMLCPSSLRYVRTASSSLWNSVRVIGEMAVKMYLAEA